VSEITVIITTLNEELHIERAVRSVHDLGSVFIVDAGSADKTCALAEAASATVVQHEWVGYSAQKNWAIDNLQVETEWLFFLDADEYVTPLLRDEIETSVKDRSKVGFHIPRRNIFCGRTLKHAWWYPDYQLRLFRRSSGRFEDRLVHEHVVVNGEAGFLEHPLVHENLKSLDEFRRRHERYAALEAAEILKSRRGLRAGQRAGRFFGSWPERRRALKTRVWYRLPGRPAIRFVWMYLLKRGFLDGNAGLLYSYLLAQYERQINAKVRELERAEKPASAGVR
jgi:glycosyltransferase involved in cell wall biosynthesis